MKKIETRAKKIFFFTVLIFLFLFTNNVYALGISQREGAGSYRPQNAKFIILPVQFSNFYYDKTQTVAAQIGYSGVNYDMLDQVIAASFKENSLKNYAVELFIENAKLKEESSGRAIGQLYQDFAQILKDSVSVIWPLLGKAKKFYLGRQFGNTLKRLPLDLTDTYFIVPLGHEFESEDHKVFGFLGIAVVDQEAEIITAAAVRYDPTQYTQGGLEANFRELAERCAKKLKKEKKAKQHQPRVPELKKNSPKLQESPLRSLEKRNSNNRVGVELTSNVPQAEDSVMRSKIKTEPQDFGGRDVLFEKFRIKNMGLAGDVDNLWLGSSIQGEKNLFYLSDKQIVWYCKFQAGLRSFSAVAKKPQLYVAWYDPRGNIYQEESFTTSFGNADLARNAMKLDFLNPEPYLGVWRVEVSLNGEKLDIRNFEIAK